MSAEIENIVVELSTDPFNPELNFRAAVEYEKLDQLASAVSFYLRCAEFGYETHRPLVYTSLLKMANCFEDQKERQWTVSNYLLQAAEYEPSRPEAWFLLSRFHERSGNWQESYTFAGCALKLSNGSPLPADVGYPGKYGLFFQKAVAGWWIGRRDESKELFELLLTLDITDEYRASVKNNLERLA